MLNGSDTAVFIQKHTGLANHRIYFIMRIVHGKLCILRTQIDGTYTRLSKSYQLVISIGVFAPYEQFVKDVIRLIDPAVSVMIILCQIGKTVST